MTDSQFSARCDSCSQEYQVPNPTKTYACRHCDGQVRVEECVCPHCRTPAQVGDAFCGSCGESLKPGRPVESGVPRTKGGSRESVERRQASQELVKAFGFLKTLRIFFRIGIFIHLLGVVGTLILMSEDRLPLGTLMISLVLSVGVASVMIIGARLLFFRPFFWSVLFACLVTLTRGMDALQRDFDLLWMLGGLLWAGLFWAFVPATARVRRLLEANPDLHITRQMMGITKRVSDGDDLTEAQALAERAAWRGSMKWSGLVIGVSAVCAAVIIGNYHRPSFSSTWASFREDWESGDAAAIAGWFPESKRESQLQYLKAVKQHRGWGNSWPVPMDEEFMFADEEMAGIGIQVVEATYADGDISWSWSGVDHTWRLTKIDLPAPSFDGFEEECLRAWNLSDIPALAELFRDPAKSAVSLEKLAGRRDWETLPHASGSRVQGGGDNREVMLNTSGGTVIIRFRLQDDMWIASSIKPPKR